MYLSLCDMTLHFIQFFVSVGSLEKNPAERNTVFVYNDKKSTEDPGDSHLQWQLNLLTHIENVQKEVTSRMDLIEKEVDGNLWRICNTVAVVCKVFLLCLWITWRSLKSFKLWNKNCRQWPHWWSFIASFTLYLAYLAFRVF